MDEYERKTPEAMSAEKKCYEFGGRQEDGSPCRRPAAEGREEMEEGRCREHVDGDHAECTTSLRDTFELQSPEDGTVNVEIVTCRTHGEDVFRIHIPGRSYRTEVQNLRLKADDDVRALAWPFEGDEFQTVDLTDEDFMRMNRYMTEYTRQVEQGCFMALLPFFLPVLFVFLFV